jgi:hypothetical protein
LEILPFDGNIFMPIGTLGKFPCIYGYMPRGGGSQVKIDQILKVVVAKGLE